jgi:hypothetical protein
MDQGMCRVRGAPIMDDASARILVVTVGAMKLLLGRLYTHLYASAGLTPDAVEMIHEKWRESLRGQPLVKATDPATSDVFSDEIALEIERFLKGVENEFARGAETLRTTESSPALDKSMRSR